MFIAGGVDQQFAVRRQSGPDGGAKARSHDGAFAGIAVVAGQLVLRKNRVVLPVAAALGEPNISGIFTKGRANGFQLLVAGFALLTFDFNKLNPAAAIEVEQPEFGCAKPGGGFGGHNVIAIGRPFRGKVKVGFALGELVSLFAFQIKRPDVLAAAAV